MAALAVFCLGITTSAAAAQQAEYRAFWLDAWHSGFLSQAQVDLLLGAPGTTNGGRIRDVNCNVVIVQVRRRADVCYPSGVGEPYMSGLTPANFNGLAALIKAAHDTTGGKKRVEVHCWSVVFKTARGLVYSQHRDTPTGSLTEFDNYWPTRLGSITGPENGDGALDPGHPKALEYLVNAHMDLVNFQTTAGPDGTDGHIDGIHYDYIRFEGGTEGYNPTSVARFNARHGFSGEPDSNDPLFRQWRRDQVTAFVRQMYARIQATKPSVKQSGSFVTWNPSPWDSTREAFQMTRPYGDRPDGVYSDWDSWTQEGILDISVPMTYYNWASLPNDYVRWMNFEKDRKFDRHMIIGPGTYLNNLDNAILELLMTREPSPAGNYAHGFCGYSYASPYRISSSPLVYGDWAEFAPRLKAEVTPTWADIPEMPWKTAPAKGHIMGTVTIQTNGAWADHAVVTISGPVNRSMHVDGTGFFAFIDLPPGAYTITAAKADFANATATAQVAIGQVTGNMYERNLELSVANMPPEITIQPEGKTVFVGQDAAFSVSARGSEPLSYQWRFKQVPLANAASDVYTRLNAQLSDAGAYNVVITNPYGSVTSNPAMLMVNPPPVDIIIDNLDPDASFEGTWQTGSGAGQYGSDYRFALTRSGGLSNAVFRPYIGVPGKYDVFVWYRDGSNRPTNANWRIMHQDGVQSVAVDQTRDGGTWVKIGSALPFSWGTNGSVILSNDSTPEGRAAMADAVRFTRAPVLPEIVTDPQSRTNVAGTDASFSVIAVGDEPLSYQWHFKGGPIEGATGPDYTQISAVNIHQGEYSVMVTNPVGAVTSAVALLTVVYPEPPSVVSAAIEALGGTLNLQFTGGPGQFFIETSPDLVTWTNRAIINAGEAAFNYADSTDGSPRLFYRVRRD
jgi:uncharacterized lipoprotein YddW (UPF0748 family)